MEWAFAGSLGRRTGPVLINKSCRTAQTSPPTAGGWCRWWCGPRAPAFAGVGCTRRRWLHLVRWWVRRETWRTGWWQVQGRSKVVFVRRRWVSTRLKSSGEADSSRRECRWCVSLVRYDQHWVWVCRPSASSLEWSVACGGSLPAGCNTTSFGWRESTPEHLRFCK